MKKFFTSAFLIVVFMSVFVVGCSSATASSVESATIYSKDVPLDNVNAEIVPGSKAASRQSFLGVWQGYYYAAQGKTALKLTITAGLNANAIEAVFSFSAHPDNPGVPSGEYKMKGMIDSVSGYFDLKGTEWIKKPTSYYMVSLDGYQKNVSQLSGKVDGKSSYPFALNRVETAAPNRIELNKYDLVLPVDGTFSLGGTVYPYGASQSITWRSNDQSIVQIKLNADGKGVTLTGIKTGSTKVTATSTKDSSVIATCAVKVDLKDADNNIVTSSTLSLDRSTTYKSLRAKKGAVVVIPEGVDVTFDKNVTIDKGARLTILGTLNVRGRLRINSGSTFNMEKGSRLTVKDRFDWNSKNYSLSNDAVIHTQKLYTSSEVRNVSKVYVGTKPTSGIFTITQISSNGFTGDDFTLAVERISTAIIEQNLKNDRLIEYVDIGIHIKKNNQLKRKTVDGYSISISSVGGNFASMNGAFMTISYEAKDSISGRYKNATFNCTNVSKYGMGDYLKAFDSEIKQMIQEVGEKAKSQIRSAVFWDDLLAIKKPNSILYAPLPDSIKKTACKITKKALLGKSIGTAIKDANMLAVVTAGNVNN